MELLTLRQAATVLGITPDTLRAQIHRQKLQAIKYGRDWLVTSEEVDRYRRESHRDNGRRDASA